MDRVSRNTEFALKSYQRIIAIKVKSPTNCLKISNQQHYSDNSHNKVGIWIHILLNCQSSVLLNLLLEILIYTANRY